MNSQEYFDTDSRHPALQEDGLTEYELLKEELTPEAIRIIDNEIDRQISLNIRYLRRLGKKNKAIETLIKEVESPQTEYLTNKLKEILNL